MQSKQSCKKEKGGPGSRRQYVRTEAKVKEEIGMVCFWL